MNKLVATVVILFISSFSFASPLPPKPHVYVEGSATVEVEPNEMSFSITIAEVSDQLSDAKKSVDERSRELISLCKGLGIATEDIATTTLRIRPAFKYENNERVPNGTTVSREVDIYLRDLSKYAGVIQAFVSAKISQTIETKLIVSDSSVVIDQALVLALEDAEQRATKLAKHQGKKLGGVFSISEFMTRGEERYMLQVSRNIVGKSSSVIKADMAYKIRSPAEPFEPGVMVAKAQVYVVYLLK